MKLKKIYWDDIVADEIEHQATKRLARPQSMMTQSPTSLQTFLTCPKQYHAKYITKEVKFEQNDHATFGDLVHKSIENYLKHQEPLPTILLALVCPPPASFPLRTTPVPFCLGLVAGRAK